MLIFRRIIPFLIIVAISALAWTSYRADTVGERLFREYFDPQTAVGYGTARTVGSAPVSEQDASLLRQLLRYHQQGRYAEALAASRAFLESNPASADHRPYLLGSTAAVEIGEYEVADYLLAGMPAEEDFLRRERDWYRALLSTRAEDFPTAITLLERSGVTDDWRETLLGTLRRL